MATSLTIGTLSCLLMIFCVLFKPQISVRGKVIDTYWVVISAGALMMIISGCIDIKTVFSALSADTAVNPLKILVLFICMTILSVLLDEIGFFAYLANKSLGYAGKNQFKLFLILYITVSLLTIFTSNDIIILTFTPFICYFSKNAKINPLPYLVAQFIAANTWSMMLIVGNPTNIYLATVYHVNFIYYIKIMVLPTVAAGIVAFVILWLFFRKHLSTPLSVCKTTAEINDIPMLIIGLIHLSVCTVILAASSYLDIEMWSVSLISVISLFVFIFILSAFRRKKPVVITNCLKRAPWQLIPFVLSMFILILALDESGVTKLFSGLLGTDNTILRYGFSSFLSANIINNIPMSVLFCSVIDAIPATLQIPAVFATVIGSNLGAFLTPIGALAGIMWTMILKKKDITYTYFDFLKYGFSVSVPSLLGALSVLGLEF
ncbi:MAG: hypothetical protein IJO74_05410 [Clostridia bacterium]|nr:hypothetical protein [Clostridia bacterium]